MASSKSFISKIAGLAGIVLTGAGVYKYVSWSLMPDYIYVDVFAEDGSRHMERRKNWNKYPLEGPKGKEMDSFVLVAFKKCKRCGLPVPMGIMSGKQPFEK